MKKNKYINKPILESITLSYTCEGDDGVVRHHTKFMELSYPETLSTGVAHFSVETTIQDNPHDESKRTKYDVLPAYDCMSDIINMSKAAHQDTKNQDRIEEVAGESYWETNLEDGTDITEELYDV